MPRRKILTTVKLWLPVSAGTSAFATFFCPPPISGFIPPAPSGHFNASLTSSTPPTKTLCPACVPRATQQDLPQPLLSTLPPQRTAASVFTFTDSGRNWSLTALTMLCPMLPVFSRNLLPSWAYHHLIPPLAAPFLIDLLVPPPPSRERTLLTLGLLL